MDNLPQWRANGFYDYNESNFIEFQTETDGFDGKLARLCTKESA